MSRHRNVRPPARPRLTLRSSHLCTRVSEINRHMSREVIAAVKLSRLNRQNRVQHFYHLAAIARAFCL